MTPETGPETLSWLRIVFAFAVIFALLGALNYGLKKMVERGVRWPLGGNGNAATRRLAIKETLALDMRRRIVIVQCDDEEHLLLLGQQQDVVIARLRNDKREPS